MAESIFLSGEVGYDVTVKSLQDKFDELESKDVTLYITTIGGVAVEGIAMYNFLKVKQKEGYHITTVANGITASAGTLIYLAGNKDSRKVAKNTIFLIHRARSFSGGTVDDINKVADDLAQLDDKMADIYATETNLSKEQALALMDEDRALTDNELVSMGFASEMLEFQAVAKLTKNNNKHKNQIMGTVKLDEKDKSWLEQMFAKLGKTFGTATAKIVMDATGDVEINFTELSDSDKEKVGDKATINGQAANGEFVMPDGSTYVFKDGVLIEIKPKTDDNTGNDLDKLKEQLSDLQTQLEQAKAQLETAKAEAKLYKTQLATASSEFAKFKAEITTKFKLDGIQTPAKPDDNGIRNRKLF